MTVCLASEKNPSRSPPASRSPSPDSRSRSKARWASSRSSCAPKSRSPSTKAKKQLVVTRRDDSRQARALHGLSRALIENMVEGVTKGYEKKLEIVGVGYLAAVQKGQLQLRVGFANEVHMPIPAGLNVTCPDQTHVVDQGQRQANGRPVRRRSARRPQARAVQGQGHALRRRSRAPQGRQGHDEVSAALSDCANAVLAHKRRGASRTQQKFESTTVNHDKAIDQQRQRRQFRVRKRIHGTAERPRLTVFRSHKHIYAQVIDDAAGRTLAAASTVDKDLRGDVKYGGNKAAAQAIGKAIAERAMAAGIKQGGLRPRRIASITAASRPWPTLPARPDSIFSTIDIP